MKKLIEISEENVEKSIYNLHYNSIPLFELIKRAENFSNRLLRSDKTETNVKIKDKYGVTYNVNLKKELKFKPFFIFQRFDTFIMIEIHIKKTYIGHYDHINGKDANYFDDFIDSPETKDEKFSYVFKLTSSLRNPFIFENVLYDDDKSLQEKYKDKFSLNLA